MICVSTPGTLNLVFSDKNDLENVIKDLKYLLDYTKDEPENIVKIYSLSDDSLPLENLRETCNFLKERYSK